LQHNASSIYLVRRTEGENNIDDAHWIPDAILTPKGKQQCVQQRKTFPYHNTISIVMSSPLRRVIRTAALSFGSTLKRPDVQYLLVPIGQ
jgi:broad specificity phosphatase PhoE